MLAPYDSSLLCSLQCSKIEKLANHRLSLMLKVQHQQIPSLVSTCLELEEQLTHVSRLVNGRKVMTILVLSQFSKKYKTQPE